MMSALHLSRQLSLLLICIVSGLCTGAGSLAAELQGKPTPSSLTVPDVVGGVRVSPWQSPWQVALVSANGSPAASVFCGGTLIDSQWVLTAAHCFYERDTCLPIPPQAIFVAYGSTDLGKKVSLMAPKALFHPDEYRCSAKTHDIALIKLDESVVVSPYVQLASSTMASTLLMPGTRLLTTGWGLTTVNGAKSRFLMEVELPVANYELCRTAYGSVLPATAICAGETSRDACTGDSGGPLYKRKENNQAIQVGVVSFGDGCGKAKTPGVYTPVAEYITWIKETLKPKPCTPKDIAEKRC
jgi:secreted trypsin-like serine protease